MTKPELLLPAGNIDSLRAAVNNGANAVYLGLQEFNARRNASNFNINNLKSIVDYCHKHKVRVYVTMNILVKNYELESFMQTIHAIQASKADAVIIQNCCLAYLIKKHYPKFEVHLSTQATVTNKKMIPKEVDRVVLARELGIKEIKAISEDFKTEVFVHGALCVSYSGQCLFSSIVGGRSGNRGLCAQPCRQKYNNKYLLSTKDLCLLEELPALAKAGVTSLKVEGRMRSPLYVATVAKIYSKYLSQLDNWKGIKEKDIEELQIVFSREFTKGFGYEESIISSAMSSNRGLFLGKVRDGSIRLRTDLEVEDKITVWNNEDSKEIIIDKVGLKGELFELRNIQDNSFVYLTKRKRLKPFLGEQLVLKDNKVEVPNFKFDFPEKKAETKQLIVRAYNLKSAIEADKAGCDIIYYDLFKTDFKELESKLKNAKLFANTQRILTDETLNKTISKIEELKPTGILVGNKGLYEHLKDSSFELHLDYSFNIFNDLDLDVYKGLPVISPELSFDDLRNLKNKNFISLIHGQITLMTLKENIKAPELVDDDGRHFTVHQIESGSQILNSHELGLFNRVRELDMIGVKNFLIDGGKELGKFVRIYKKIISGEDFDDKKIKKGFTTGHFDKGVE
jgi:U32 family peptidase